MSVLDMVTGSIGGTKSYYDRRYVWVPCENHPDGRIGSLTIICQKGKWGRPSDDSDTYGVQDAHGKFPNGVRGFFLKNDTDDSQPDIYECIVGSDDSGLVHDRCTCPASQCRVPTPCKHKSVLSELISLGHL